MKAVILAGGLGTRLHPYTIFLPKPMLPLGEKPILEHLLEWVRRNGIGTAVLCVSYLRRSIEEYFGDGSRFGIDIEYAASDRPLATAGQLKTAEPLLDDTFVCMYGDSLFDFGLRGMARQHRKRGSAVTMALRSYSTRLRYGVIETSRGGAVTGWDEKPEITASINVGCYVMEPDVLGYIPRGVPYGMDAVVKKALRAGRRVDGYVTRGSFTDIGDRDSYEEAHRRHVERLGSI